MKGTIYLVNDMIAAWINARSPIVIGTGIKDILLHNYMYECADGKRVMLHPEHVTEIGKL